MAHRTWCVLRRGRRMSVTVRDGPTVGGVMRESSGRGLGGLVLAAALVLLPAAAAGEARMGLSRENVGKEVAVVGRVSQMPWQHMIRADTGKQAEYIDLQEGGQIVAYLASPVACGQPVLLEGKVLLTEGGAKRPGSKETASELQLDVGRWTCLDEKGMASLLKRLGDTAATREAKAGAEAGLIAAGKAAIPLLMDHLGDPTICWTDRVLLNEGALTNRPSNAPPAKEQWGEEKITVGERCEAMLTRIIWPADYRSPYAGNFKPVSGGSAPFRVEDWKSWWAKNRSKSLEEIRKAIEPVLDAYWESKGTQQVIR